MNPIILKLWIENEISKINYQIELGGILPVVGKAKIELLETMVDDFNLEVYTQEDYTLEKNF
jgi:hypothetical protein